MKLRSVLEAGFRVPTHNLEPILLNIVNSDTHFLQSVSITIEGNDYYEAQQTSKEQKKMPRFMSEGPRQCTIFCFAFMHYAWIRNQNISIG